MRIDDGQNQRRVQGCAVFKARRGSPQLCRPPRARLRTDFAGSYVGNFTLIMTDDKQMSTRGDSTFKEFERLVSRHRLKRYRRETASKSEAVALYIWNIALCEALYPAFHFLEVARRMPHMRLCQISTGAIHAGLGDPTVLTEVRHQQQVVDAISDLIHRGKGHLARK